MLSRSDALAFTSKQTEEDTWHWPPGPVQPRVSSLPDQLYVALDFYLNPQHLSLCNKYIICRIVHICT